MFRFGLRSKPENLNLITFRFYLLFKGIVPTISGRDLYAINQLTSCILYFFSDNMCWLAKF